MVEATLRTTKEEATANSSVRACLSRDFTILIPSSASGYGGGYNQGGYGGGGGY